MTARDNPVDGPRRTRTVAGMPKTPRSAVVGRISIVSDNPYAGEAYRRTVTVQTNGRVSTLTECADRERTARTWDEDQPPNVADLAQRFVEALEHTSEARLLSAVVHGLLPQGDHLKDASLAIPDAVLDSALAFGSRIRYRIDIGKGLSKELRDRPEISWANDVQRPGAPAHQEFTAQLAEAAECDRAWLLESLRRSLTETGEWFDDLVAEFAPTSAKDEVAKTYAADRDAPRVIYWDDYAGGSFALVPEGWYEANISPLQRLATASTWGEARALAKPFWVECLLDSCTDDRADNGLETEDVLPFDVAHLKMDSSSLLDCMVVPWDLEALKEWFPEWDMDIIRTHCRTGGASPGGHIDVYTPQDVPALLAALEARGYQVEHRDFLSDLQSALAALATF